MKPVLDEISNERDVMILTLDLDANKELSKLYNIKSIPTHIIYIKIILKFLGVLVW